MKNMKPVTYFDGTSQSLVGDFDWNITSFRKIPLAKRTTLESYYLNGECFKSAHCPAQRFECIIGDI